MFQLINFYRFYQTMRELSETRLQDGTGRRPHYRYIKPV